MASMLPVATGTCAHTHGPTGFDKSAVHDGVSAENDGTNGLDVAGKDGFRTERDGTFDDPMHVSGSTRKSSFIKDHRGRGSERQGSVEYEGPVRAGYGDGFRVHKGKVSGQADGSGRFVGSRLKRHAVQVAGDGEPALQRSVVNIGFGVCEALGSINSRRRLESRNSKST
jgi:hypothetical protein